MTTFAPTSTDSVAAGGEAGGPLAIGQSFGGRYDIIRVLGVGGMGAVYQAWDNVLGVTVAIKVIRPDVMADPTTAAEVERRFKRELVLARQVTNENVVRIHDLGEIDGIKYITMSYVEGEDLATILRREGKLDVRRTLRIARKVLSGLAAAHRAGVVHRDLKPANIMIDSAAGNALIMDFGIARSAGGAKTLEAASRPSAGARRVAYSEGATTYGVVVGTVEYMAPEQARGQDVDQRADIYAVGLILYDMLVGRQHRAQHTESAIAELRARMEQPPPPITSADAAIPAALEHMVSRCLEPDPAKRYQTSEELAADLARLDDDGVPIPEPRRFTPRLIAAAVAVVAVLVTGTWWLTRTPPPPKQHDPVTVLIADFQNNTKEPDFDHTLEPMFRRALESAGFISAYDRSRIRPTFGVRPPDRLDELAAREIALKQGVGIVVSGVIDRRNNGYQVSVKAAETVTGKVIDTATSRPANKDQVVGNATKLVTTIRKALGDETSDSAQLLAMRSLSTTSMAVAGPYAAALEAQSDGKMEEARASYQKTVELDPNFGLGYQGLAIMSRNLGKLEDANKYTTEALKHLEGMTDRERLAVRASYYMNTGDFQQCVKEYGELIAQFTADAIGHNNRALCLSKLRNMREAADELRHSIQILPKRATLRANLAMLGNYAGDFETAERETKALQEGTDYSTLAVAFTHLGQGRVPEAAETYNKLASMTVRGASWAASGMGDLAVYEGRFSDAIRAFEQGAAADLAAKNPDRAARKLTSLANVYFLNGQKNQAIATADKALTYSKAVPVRFLAARVFVEAGAVPKAQPIADGLSAELPAEPHAYGKIIQGEIALKRGNTRQAIDILTDAGSIVDAWLTHFDLGRAYLEAKAYQQASSEFDRCIKRRGEALAFLVDEEPTSGYFPPVYYYQGVVRDGLNSTKAAESYRDFLNIRGNSMEDPLVPAARKRAGGGATGGTTK
jgi:serine/threonine protein kinase/Flp pilus assembly protein TadD